MSVMSAGKPVGLDGTVAPLRPRRGGISRRGSAGVPRVGVPRVGVSSAAWSRAAWSRAGVSRAGVSRAGVWGAGVPGTGVSARVGVSQQRGIGLAVSRQAQRAASVRLTRRGRIVVRGLLTVAVLLAAVLLWLAAAARAQPARAQAASAGSPPGAVHRNLTPVVVHPGESLWSIALRAQPSADPRIVVQQIIELNALSGTGIEPGERLWVPRG